jgi:hypothetical protein
MSSNDKKANSSLNLFKYILIYIGKFLIRAAKKTQKLFNWIIKHILVLATIVTAIAAIITIYFTILQPAKIEIQAGSFVAITPGCGCGEIDESRYILKIPVSFYNDGAKPGILGRVGLVIKDPNSMYAYFFKSNYDEILKEEKGKKVWQLNSAFSPIIIPSRNAISRNLRFATSGFVFSPNKAYDFWILAWDKESKNPTYRKKFKFSFESDEIKSVEKTRKSQEKLIPKNSSNLQDQDGNTITSPENGKYGPITGAMGDRTYKSLTGSSQSLFHFLVGEDE